MLPTQYDWVWWTAILVPSYTQLGIKSSAVNGKSINCLWGYSVFCFPFQPSPTYYLHLFLWLCNQMNTLWMWRSLLWTPTYSTRLFEIPSSEDSGADDAIWRPNTRRDSKNAGCLASPFPYIGTWNGWGRQNAGGGCVVSPQLQGGKHFLQTFLWPFHCSWDSAYDYMEPHFWPGCSFVIGRCADGCLE